MFLTNPAVISCSIRQTIVPAVRLLWNSAPCVLLKCLLTRKTSVNSHVGSSSHQSNNLHHLKKCLLGESAKNRLEWSGDHCTCPPHQLELSIIVACKCAFCFWQFGKEKSKTENKEVNSWFFFAKISGLCWWCPTNSLKLFLWWCCCGESPAIPSEFI